jgi:hypothetical protein
MKIAIFRHPYEQESRLREVISDPVCGDFRRKPNAISPAWWKHISSRRQRQIPHTTTIPHPSPRPDKNYVKIEPFIVMFGITKKKKRKYSEIE